MKPRTSYRTGYFTESVIREMTRLSLIHGGVNLAQGYPDFPAPEAVKKAAIEAIQKDINQYAITWGAKTLKKVPSYDPPYFHAWFFCRGYPALCAGRNRHCSRGFLGGAKLPKPGVSKGDVFPFGQGRGLMPRPRRAKVEPRRRRWLDVASLFKICQNGTSLSLPPFLPGSCSRP